LGVNSLAERLSRGTRLTRSEQEALATLEEQERRVRRGTTVLREGEKARELFFVRSGWMHSSVVTGSGGRQILGFYFPGDMVGLPLLAFSESPATVTAVTDCETVPIPRDRIGALIISQPRIGALLLALSAAECTHGWERIASIGRNSARGRVSVLLCEIYFQLRRSGQAEGNRVALPLTQEDIGDATGLTAVHVNRMMRSLVDDGIIERSSGHFTVTDEGRLCEEAGLEHRRADTGWIPPPT
jgi:CRP-like cAMP-binding protein